MITNLLLTTLFLVSCGGSDGGGGAAPGTESNSNELINFENNNLLQQHNTINYLKTISVNAVEISKDEFYKNDQYYLSLKNVSVLANTKFFDPVDSFDIQRMVDFRFTNIDSYALDPLNITNDKNFDYSSFLTIANDKLRMSEQRSSAFMNLQATFNVPKHIDLKNKTAIGSLYCSFGTLDSIYSIDYNTFCQTIKSYEVINLEENSLNVLYAKDQYFKYLIFTLDHFENNSTLKSTYIIKYEKDSTYNSSLEELAKLKNFDVEETYRKSLIIYEKESTVDELIASLNINSENYYELVENVSSNCSVATFSESKSKVNVYFRGGSKSNDSNCSFELVFYANGSGTELKRISYSIPLTVTDPVIVEKSCKGYAYSCSSISSYSCSSQLGCSYDYYYNDCSGYRTSCYSITNEYSCRSQLGCSWQ